MAAKAGQVLQAELLVVYGADPGAPDINGRTPMDYARYACTSESSKISFLFSRLILLLLLVNHIYICCLLSHLLCMGLIHRQAGQVELAERLVECQYELTDRLAFYLCGRRPGELSAVFF